MMKVTSTSRVLFTLRTQAHIQLEQAIRKLEPIRTKRGRPPLTAKEMAADVHSLLVEAREQRGSQKRPTASMRTTSLDLIREQALRLVEMIDGLHDIDRAAIDGDRKTRFYLRLLEVQCRFRSAEMSDLPAIPKRLPSPHRLAITAGWVFLNVTGRRPGLSTVDDKPSGHFVEFVRAVFAARMVRSYSPESSAKVAAAHIRSMERKPIKSGS